MSDAGADLWEPTVHGAKIVQLVAAPAQLADEHGNVYAGYALCELDLEYANGEHVTGRDILPFGTDGGIIGAPAGAYYQLHVLGDDRPPFADSSMYEAAA